MEPFLTPKEVASLLRITQRMVYSLLESGQLPGFKIGRVWRVNEEDLKAYLEKRKHREPTTE